MRTCAFIPTIVIALALCVVGPACLAASAAEQATASSAGILQGKVTDSTGAGIAAVEVWIPEIGRMALTARDGSYRFTGLAPAPYTLALRRVGYEAATRTVTVSGDTTLDATLAISPFAAEPVVVTATPSAIRPNQSSFATSTLSGELLRKHETVSLAHAIEQLPGVNTISTGAQVGKPVIRGMTGARVLVLDDSRRLEDYSWSDEDGPSIDARLADRVEVIRGPASLLYGSDAFGGVVNSIPRPLPEAPPGGSFRRAGLEVYGGSNNLEVGSGLRLEGAQGRLGWRAFGVGRYASDLRTPAGALRNTGFFAVNGEGAVGVRGEKGDVGLRFVRYGGEFKLLEANASPEEKGGPERRLGDNRLQLGAHWLVSGIRFETRAQWQLHNLIEVADSPNPAPGEPKESEQFNLLLNTGTLDLLAHHQHGRWRTSAGVSGLAQSNDSRGKIPLVPDAHLSSGAVFGLEQLGLGHWNVMAGVRGDFQHLDADANPDLLLADHSRNDSQLSANGGVVYSPVRGLSLAANVGRAWRAPTLFELYSNGPHLGELRYEKGNPDLESEHGLSLDGGVRWEGKRLAGEVTGFRNHISNFIFITPTNDYLDSLRVYRNVQADVMLAGGELGLQVEARRDVSLRGRFDYVWGQNEQLVSPLPLIPPARGVLGATLHREDLSWASRASVGAELDLVSRQDRLSEFDTPTASYALVHLDAGVARRWGGRDLQFDLAVRNLADVRYRDYLSRYKEFALNQGRNVMFRVSTGL